MKIRRYFSVIQMRLFSFIISRACSFDGKIESPENDCDKDFRENGSCSKEASYTQRIVLGEDDQMEFVGFKINKFKSYMTWLFYILSGGLLRLFLHWYPQIKLYATHSVCSLEMAEKVLIVDIYKTKFKSYFVKEVRTRTAAIKGREEFRESSSEVLNNSNYNLTVHLENGKVLELPSVRTFKCKKTLYIWDPEQKLFQGLIGLNSGKHNSDFHLCKGLDKKEQALRRIIYGPNEINIPVQSILTLLILEALTPFYLFQVFSITIWLAESYYYYGIAIVIMSLYGISSSIIQTRTNQKNLKGTVSSEGKVTICRGGDVFEEIETTELVPGDLIALPPEGCNMQCDAVLIAGNCIVNESMLTGESVPVHKTPLPNNKNHYRVKEDSLHTLFCGTTILQTKYCSNRETLAVVIRTGYLTAKGELVRSILYPPPADFKFEQDSYKFIIILGIIAAMGLVYTVVTKISRNLPFWDIALKALDLITIAIPPALPAAMTIGKLYAQERLKKKWIYCINSRVINVSGSVNCVCFDKTGTLTEDELDLWGVQLMKKGNLDVPVRDIKSLSVNDPLFKGMLTCHTLSVLDGKLCGDPLDLKMFNSTAWHFEEIYEDNYNHEQLIPQAAVHPGPIINGHVDDRIEVYLQFPFVSALQRASVVCKDAMAESNFEVYCKGSPETIIALSKPHSVPDDIFHKLKIFTTKGYRVIAMGTKTLDLDRNELAKLTRDQIESDLIFLGLIILENKLKMETTGVIKTLNNAGLKIIMITGDNTQTAVSVAKECGIIKTDSLVLEVTANYSSKEGPSIRYYPFNTDVYESVMNIKDQLSPKVYDPEIMYEKYQFVMNGKSWANIVEYFPEIVSNIVKTGAVFSRMSSHQKQEVIEALKNMGYYVAMCGDGANDCAALKAAHLGISLSEAEASIAAPFTAKEANISCVPKIIREGRAALLTSFGVFKFMVCGSLTEFFSTTILYGIDCNLSSMQFLFMDIFLQLNLASFFGNTKACEKLYHKPPLTSLLSFIPLISMVLFMVQTVCFQIFSFYFIRYFNWYKPFVYTPHVSSVSGCQENYSIFVIAMFQYITMAIIFSKGKPYRLPIHTNKIFSFLIFLVTILCIYISIYPSLWILNLLEMEVPPEIWSRWEILTIALANFGVAFFVEEFLIDKFLDKIVLPSLERFRYENKNESTDLIREGPDYNKTVIHDVDERADSIMLNKKLSRTREDNGRIIITKC